MSGTILKKNIALELIIQQKLQKPTVAGPTFNNEKELHCAGPLVTINMKFVKHIYCI